MKWKTATASAAVVVATGGVAGGWAAASSASTPLAGSFTLRAHQTSFHIVDTGKRGDSAGDFGTLTGKLFNSGHQVGRYVGQCVQMDGRGHSLCNFVFALPTGQLDIEAAYGRGLNGNRRTHDAVVGGTRTYATARGDAVGRETGATGFIEVVHLQQ